MKKLLCLALLATMIVGCSSNNQGEEKDAKKEYPISEETEKKENNNEDKQDEDSEEKKDVTESKSNTNSNEEETKPTEDKRSNQASGNTANGNENSNEAGTTTTPPAPTPPKEEKPTPPPVVDPTPEPPTNQQAKANQVFAQINAYRQQNGKEPFAYSSLLKSQSDAHALAMATREALWHSGGAAECITNYDDPFNAWKNSPAHNEILLCNNTEAAVGIYYYNGYYYSVFQCQW